MKKSNVETWIQRCYVDENVNRILLKVRFSGKTAWKIIATEACEDHETSEDMLQALSEAWDGVEHGDGRRLEAWGDQRMQVSRFTWPLDDLEEDAAPDAGAMSRASAERDRDRYVAALHKNNLALLGALPNALEKLLGLVSSTLEVAREDRDRWRETTLALLEHGDQAGKSDASDRIRALARDDLHHGMRALMSAAATRFAGIPADGEATRVLSELGASLDPEQVARLAAVLRPEQAQALLQLLAAAQEAARPPAPAGNG